MQFPNQAPLEILHMNSSGMPADCQSISRSVFKKVIDRIFETRTITREDHNVLLRATVSEYPLTMEELTRVRRVIERLQMGLLRVVD
jgi:transcriptional regulator CtsR